MAKIIETYYGPHFINEEPIAHEAIVHDKKVKVLCPGKKDGKVVFTPVTGRMVEFTSLKGYFFIMEKVKGEGYYFRELETGMLIDTVFASCKGYQEAIKYILEYSNFRSIINNPENSNWEQMHTRGKKNYEEWMTNWKNEGAC